MIDRFALHLAPAVSGAAGSAASDLLRAVAESAGPEQVGRFGTLLHPDAGIARLAWRRLGLGEHGERRYSLCGIVHDSASHAAMEAIAGLLASPVRGWDAVICPSRVVRDSVRAILERQADYLGVRLGATRFELPQLPLIPPGVHSRDLQFDGLRRRAARERFGIGADDVAFLHVGALSFHAGAHPRQMLSALERAATAGATLHLLLCGCFAGEAGEQAFREAAALLAPSVRLIVHDGGAHDASAWAAADVFTALGDSVQVRPNATTLKAMAAGLPCVVSDWGLDRDLVRNGVDGYRIPTTMPAPGAGLDLAQRYDDGVDSYDQYCGHMGQTVALDGSRLAEVYARLIGDAGLRRELGDHARRRAQQEFDWSVVFARYRQLWSELDERRRAGAALTPASLPTLEEFGQIFGSIESRPMQVDELLDTLGPRDRSTLLRGLAWLC